MRIPTAVKLYKEALPDAFPGLSIGNDLSNRTSVVSASASWTIWPDVDTGKTHRCSAADALLWAPSQQRPTLTVLANHTVTRILFTSAMTAHGVVFTDSTLPNDLRKMHQVRARKGVVLAAGTLATAPILERSGIGRQDVLDAANIKQLVDLPGVGVNLNVHISIQKL